MMVVSGLAVCDTHHHTSQPFERGASRCSVKGQGLRWRLTRAVCNAWVARSLSEGPEMAFSPGQPQGKPELISVSHAARNHLM